MVITSSMKMADVIIQNHHLLSVINRFGISLGFGESSIAEVCYKNNISVDFFLEILNTSNDPSFFPEKNLDSFPLKLIVDYLYEAHKNYRKYKIPEIKVLIETLFSESSSENEKFILLIKNFFSEYATQLLEHIEKEEKNIYPYVLDLENIYESLDSTLIENFISKYNFTIDTYAEEHDDIEEKLYDIKSLIIKYIKPQSNFLICFKLLGQLSHLEEDIKYHTDLENRILIPRVRIMEAKLIRK